ncbi:hypothetical protein GFS31_02690 [Leptolyngbya sp. BL0902]|uniref:hypothetical protein n=1 Tax=Leptolyngbya sp. BL0902 TaxID=1115757 RepID=UPI0018E75BD9|nr:hypothetical protein [Leptolyngbya sp. BL0902]QQE63602.1 hypothetical protein GFS31_02690 [Leptolyngbya sp. BL0902]
MGNEMGPPTLKIWLLFLLLFLMLGYGPIPSILFGLVAGLAGGVVATWWVSPGGEPKEVELPTPIRQFSRQLRETPSRLPFRGFFRRTESRYPGPRRR